MGITELVGSVLGGGVTGLLGAVVTKFTEYKTAKLNAEHEIAMKQADAQIMAQEWAARTKVAEIEGQAKVDAVDAQSFGESYKLEPTRYSDPAVLDKRQEWLMVLLDFMRGAIRPSLTVYLCVLTTMIYWQAHKLLGTNISQEQAVSLLNQIVNTVLYLTVTVVCWWFGVRTKTK